MLTKKIKLGSQVKGPPSPSDASSNSPILPQLAKAAIQTSATAEIVGETGAAWFEKIETNFCIFNRKKIY
jgi:hypothetical protein